jgi:hypothetical protein
MRLKRIVEKQQGHQTRTGTFSDNLKQLYEVPTAGDRFYVMGLLPSCRTNDGIHWEETTHLRPMVPIPELSQKVRDAALQSIQEKCVELKDHFKVVAVGFIGPSSDPDVWISDETGKQVHLREGLNTWKYWKHIVTGAR